MTVGSIGSSQSFWQQDQSFWQQSQQSDNQLAANTSVINAMGTAETNLGKGLASIANSTALNRVNSQLIAAIQSALTGTPTSAAATPTASKPSTPSPATGTGTAALSINTPLKTLGIPAGGVFFVSAGQNTTTYASTGSDTVGDVMKAINSNLVGTAAVTASLNNSGGLVLTSKDNTDTISVGGLYSSNIGFGVTNNTFKPTQAAASTPSIASTSSAPAASSSTKSSSSSGTASAAKSYTTVASETLGSAASLLSNSGAGGSLVDMLS
jgi:hypothetical protein